MKVAKYTNPTSGDVLYSSYPAETKELDGNTFMLMSFNKSLNRTFWYGSDAVKLDKVEDVK